MGAPPLGAARNCSESNCGEYCQCLEGTCGTEEIGCDADAGCRATKECAMECACGDIACVVTCSVENWTPTTVKFMGCFQTQCLPTPPPTLAPITPKPDTTMPAANTTAAPLPETTLLPRLVVV